jgi:hypothetical protein
MGDGSDMMERKAEAGPRAILRVTEVLMAVATKRGGGSLAELSQRLKLPKTSLHRILRTLEQGGFLVEQSGSYQPGPESFRLADQLRAVSPAATFPACARPEIERLATETGETVTLGVMAEGGAEIVYVDVIESEAALRYALRIGSRRPIYAVRYAVRTLHERDHRKTGAGGNIARGACRRGGRRSQRLRRRGQRGGKPDLRSRRRDLLRGLGRRSDRPYHGKPRCDPRGRAGGGRTHLADIGL